MLFFISERVSGIEGNGYTNCTVIFILHSFLSFCVLTFLFLYRSRDVENGGVGALHVVGVQAVLTEYLIRFYELIFDEKVPSVPSGEQGEGMYVFEFDS